MKQILGIEITVKGISLSADKIEGLEYLAPIKNRAELLSFRYIMQSNSELIPNFSIKRAKLQEAIKNQTLFQMEQNTTGLFHRFFGFIQKSVIKYFDVKTATFVFSDAHKSELGEILAQGS